MGPQRFNPVRMTHLSPIVIELASNLGLSQSAHHTPLVVGLTWDKNLAYVVKFRPIRVNLKTCSVVEGREIVLVSWV